MPRALCESHQKSIATGNTKSARILAVVGVLHCVVCAVLTLIIGGEAQNSRAIIYMIFTMAFIHLCCVIPRQPRKGANGLAWQYLSMGLLYAISGIGGLYFRPEDNAVAICVFVTVLPMFVVGNVRQSVLPGVVAAAAYILLAFLTASPQFEVARLTNLLLSTLIGCILGHYSVVSRAKNYRLRDTLRRQRDTDALTNVLTRRAAEQKITGILSGSDVPCVMVMIDVDNFKTINDNYGHNYGDYVLEVVSALLRSNFRTGDIICRLGGDEFIVFAVDVPDAAWIVSRLDSIQEKLAHTPLRGGAPPKLTISMGCVGAPEYGTTFEELYRKADRVLYKAKEQGKNSYCLFRDEAAQKNAASRQAV